MAIEHNARCAHPLMLTALALFTPSCSSAPVVGSCTPDPSPTLIVDTSEVPTGILTSSGACTPMTCAQSGTVGNCSRWVGDFDESSAEYMCLLQLDIPDGTRLEQTAVRGTIAPRPLEFRSNSHCKSRLHNQRGAGMVERTTFGMTSASARCAEAIILPG